GTSSSSDVGDSGVRIVGVVDARDRRRFVSLARDLYPATSPWVRPLDDTLLDYLNPQRNPFLRVGEAQAFLAMRDGRAVGRVLAHVWKRHVHLHGEGVGYFGFFECIDDAEVARALLEAAVAFARERRCERLRGPFNMTAAQEMGIVTAGFEDEPSVDMVYTPEHYPDLLKSL